MTNLVHTGFETYMCMSCGAEYIIPEDHDLPDTCEECGDEFGGVE